ncbi:hypothetical protein [Nocardia transvalensis]|uniref:hypothetical protein n=1 Tax=Nocardia transvalensis TaxID=37333 RepID=UPI001893B411|nr:hypothetical protein [Nocardia transvalensis]MBF6328720.1 hypothetical protein [Nocardia transvalensis]
MPTATVHIESVDGYAGTARCFRIDPPFDNHTYVTVCLTPSYGDIVRPEAQVFLGTETGACAELSLTRRPGSFVLHHEPDTPDRIDGAYWTALQLLGGYQITEPEPPADKPVDEPTDSETA